MKRALITIAAVGILTPAAWLAPANAQYGSPPPGGPYQASNPQGYSPSQPYSRRAARRSARRTAAAGTAYAPGSGPPPYSVPAQTYAQSNQGPWEWYAGPGPKKRGAECVTDVDINRGYGFRGACPQPRGQQRAALNPQPLPPRR